MVSGRARAGQTPLFPIDRAHLEAQTLGDRQLQRELLILFMTQAADILQQMRACAGREPQRLDDLAHRLKGSARAVGAFRVANSAERSRDCSEEEEQRLWLSALAGEIDEAVAASKDLLRSLHA
jgi:HPt (histidine-containing phosphotransfer) domain-containing protein